MFSPPLYKQRDEFVVEFVMKHKPKKVVDLGCADCRLLRRMKFHREIELLIGVDINSSVVQKKMHTLAPLPCEFLCPSNQPLTIEVYQGSVTHKEPRIKEFDLVTCIELIEHLQLADVERFSEVLFGYMAPSAVIVSTPNADFNPLLPGCSGFRNIDHKFEWTQTEFQSWALEMSRLYGYVVEFTGVGKATCNVENIGFCSQIGVFYKDPSRTYSNLRTEATGDAHPYRLLYKVVYPSLCDSNMYRRTVVNEILYWAHSIKKASDNSSGGQEKRGPTGNGLEPYLQGNAFCVPLAGIMSVPRVQALSGTMQHLRDVLLEDPLVKLTNDGEAVILSEEEEEHVNVEQDDFVDHECTETMQSRASCVEQLELEMLAVN